MILAVPVDRLTEDSSGQQVRQDAHTLRERVEEAIKELGVDIPLYIIITKCDRMEGFCEFFNQLPEWEYGTAFGYVDDPTSTFSRTDNDDTAIRKTGNERGEEAHTRVNRVNSGLAFIYERLLRFRLTILDGKAPQTARPAIFCFPEEFKALLQPLASFIDPSSTKRGRLAPWVPALSRKVR